MLVKAHEIQLVAYLLESFESSQEFELFLRTTMWPAFRTRYLAGGKAGTGGASKTTEISELFTSKEGHRLTSSQVERHAAKGVPMLQVSTGREVIYKKYKSGGKVRGNYHYTDTGECMRST